MIRIAILASGRGSNAQNIIEYFKGNEAGEVALVLTNNRNAGVLKIAQEYKKPAVVFTQDELQTEKVLGELQANNIGLVVLAGFLWLLPENIVTSFEKRIINIHPALLPKYGGKGMYGERVHQAVSDSGDSETGVTIHYVNDKYDDGDIISQFKCDIEPESDPDLIAARVHNLEMKHYPDVILSVIHKLENEQ